LTEHVNDAWLKQSRGPYFSSVLLVDIAKDVILYSVKAIEASIEDLTPIREE
jgi:hypothetical protein